MRTIHKFPLGGVINDLILQAPLIRYVAMQDGLPYLWVEIDPQQNGTRYTIQAIGTGQPVPDAQYIGTVQWDELVLHYYMAELP